MIYHNHVIQETNVLRLEEEIAHYGRKGYHVVSSSSCYHHDHQDMIVTVIMEKETNGKASEPR